MSLHKLTAGSGYTYLTRQVAALDATDKGGVGLAAYYTARGETPGAWIGSGVAGIEGLSAGDVVTPSQMQSLFGSGHHPLADEREAELEKVRTLRVQDRVQERTRAQLEAQAAGGRGAGRTRLAEPITEAERRVARRLGTPFKVYDNDISPFRVEVAKRLEAVNAAAGLPRDWPVPAAERARIRTDVAQEFFRTEHGRDAADARELAATIAKHSRPKTTAVAGYDLTFSPVKSVSTLWAVAEPAVAAKIELAHQAAIKDALGFIETKALFTRMGANGVRQVDVTGLVATAFTHRDSRAGDPDLHTHVAVANKVQTLSPDSNGRWLAIDGRVLYKAAVAASETYNTALERHLVDALGLRFEERPNPDPRKRPVREIVGVDPDLNHRFSKRRISVEARRKELAVDFQATHGRPPTPIETLHLAQQATLETREAKHEPRSLAEQREAWHREATQVLGSPRGLQQMLRQALHPASGAAPVADAAWFAKTTDRIVATMEGGRATWQYWHVYAEAQRQARAVNVPTDQVSTVVDLLVSEVLDGHSVPIITRPSDGISEPSELRRLDGASVYTVGGAQLFTSSRVLAAEQRLVDAAGRRDGFAAHAQDIALALLESEANGLTLNAGQTTLVREMATSGARLQLAIAPAGSGKTTAMEVLSRAWTASGGRVMGAATATGAAKLLGEKIQAPSDSLAMLVTAIENDLEQVRGIGPHTLLIIDEAGMADTLSLDTVVGYVLTRGGSVRLIGDDQQLAAIGAGGVLRDIQTTHGALQLTELVRFHDPAEGAASLALREGKPEALGFYLDRDRVQVGDLTTMTEEVFAAWQADRAQGLDSMMLAPSRELVNDLNRRAQASRLEAASPTPSGPWVELSDGNAATIGDVVVTRDNNRKLRVSATDWVKNGDRWTVVSVNTENGTLSAKHLKHGRIVQLPADYVCSQTELGYASTVHRAQGLTADKTHGLATGQESRQLLYTLLSRGAISNHLYLEVVGDGDPHSVIHPTLIRPPTPTDILESMLARDEAQRSATSLLREQADPATRLGDAAQRYLDSLYAAAENIVGHDVVDALDRTADQVLPGLADEAAWPTLRAHLLLLGANGEDPVEALRSVASDRELVSAEDRAAVLDWRLDASGMRNAGTGPLPWMPAVPKRLANDPHWGSYLAQRAQLVTELADQVRERATAAASLPSWAQNGRRLDAATVADVEVWRAAMQVAGVDRRPTGAPQMQKAAATYQRRLNRRVAGDHTPALKEWSHLLHGLAPQVRGDQFTPLLAERLAAMARAGVAAHELVTKAAAAGPLPDEHAAAALWWRMAKHLTPAVAAQIGDGNNAENVTTDWAHRLVDLFGAERAHRIQASSWWPALVSNVDHGLQRGWQPETLLSAGAPEPPDDVDECQALVWRTSIALEPIPDEHAHDYHFDAPPQDMWQGVEPPEGSCIVDAPETQDAQAAAPVGALAQWPEEEAVTRTPTENVGLDVGLGPSGPVSDPPARVTSGRVTSGRAEQVDVADVDGEEAVFHRLRRAALARDLNRIPLAPSPADENRAYEREVDLADSPVSAARMREVNAMAQAFFERNLPGSWGQQHLMERFGVDLTSHEYFRPGQAPAGWTGLVQHLRRRGVTDEELLATGLATTASTGRLIDRFRDRVMFPITSPGHSTASGRDGEAQILGFVGRRHPDLADVDPATGERNTKAGPKYLNTADTALFHKGAQLYAGFYGAAGAGGIGELLEAGAVPVVVEGPMDAIAVTVATAGSHVGVAPLGTSLTDDQANQLAFLHHRTGAVPIVATDPDLAGRVAAERAFWMLTPHGLDPRYARLPAHCDPADLLERRGPAAVAAALATAGPLADQLLDERLEHLDRSGRLPEQASSQAIRAELARVVAARSPEQWINDVARIAARLDLSDHQVQHDLLHAVEAWAEDPRKPAQQALGSIHQVRERLEAAETEPPVERWAPLGASLDPRLPHEPDWGAAAMMIQDAHDQGHDVAAAARQLVEEKPLNERPAQDLRYRLVGRLDIEIPDFDDVNPHLDAQLGAATKSPAAPPAPSVPSAPEAGPDDVPAAGRSGSGAAHERRRAAGPTRGDNSGPRPGSQRR